MVVDIDPALLDQILQCLDLIREARQLDQCVGRQLLLLEFQIKEEFNDVDVSVPAGELQW